MKSSRLAATLAVRRLALAPARSSPSRQEIAFDSAGDFLKLPDDIHLGEVAGVATTSKGNIWSTPAAAARTRRSAPRASTSTAARGCSSSIAPESFCARSAARPQQPPLRLPVCAGRPGRSPGQHLGRGPRLEDGRQVRPVRPRPADAWAAGPRRSANSAAAPVAVSRPRVADLRDSGVPGDNFNQPTDVAWDAAGNIFVTDGYGNARVAKFDKNGKFIKSWGATGTEPGQFNIPHSIAVDAARQRLRRRYGQ